VSNILVHREFSGTFPARVVVEKTRLVAENWNRSLRPGRIEAKDFEPYPKNPILARFFVNIGYADTLGSGVRNLYNFTKIYSGGEPELLEGNIFQTIVPLLPSENYGVTEKVTDRVTEQATEQELTILGLLKENSAYTYPQLAEKLNISRKTVGERIKSLRGKGALRRIGSDRKGYWEIID
jgi:ATP-dependent DNA helicase RecG